MLLALAIFVVTAVIIFWPGIARGDHDGEDQPWRVATLAACEPRWNPDDARIVTWDGRTLHEESFDVRDLFYRVWGQGNPEGMLHVRRWRFEYECLHPASAKVTASRPQRAKAAQAAPRR